MTRETDTGHTEHIRTQRTHTCMTIAQTHIKRLNMNHHPLHEPKCTRHAHKKPPGTTQDGHTIICRHWRTCSASSMSEAVIMPHIHGALAAKAEESASKSSARASSPLRTSFRGRVSLGNDGTLAEQRQTTRGHHRHGKRHLRDTSTSLGVGTGSS